MSRTAASACSTVPSLTFWCNNITLISSPSVRGSRRTRLDPFGGDRNRPQRGCAGWLREQVGEALPPARVAERPAEFALGLGARRAARLGRHHDRRLAREERGD